MEDKQYTRERKKGLPGQERPSTIGRKRRLSKEDLQFTSGRKTSLQEKHISSKEDNESKSGIQAVY